MLRYTCQSCLRGEHKFCSGKNPPPPGMLGGRECICEGDCKPSPDRQIDGIEAALDSMLEAAFDSIPTDRKESSMPEETKESQGRPREDWGDIKDDVRYQFTGLTLKTILHEVAGATSRVFMEKDPDLVMPSEEIVEAVREYAKLSPEHWGSGGKAAEGVLGTGALTLGAEGVKQVRRLIDQEGTPQDYEQMIHILDGAIAAGKEAEGGE